MNQPMTGVLHMIPVPIAEPEGASVLPATTCRAAQSLTRFVVENARSARRALKLLGHPGPLQDLAIAELPVAPKGQPEVPAPRWPGDPAVAAAQARLGPSVAEQLDALLAPLLQGESIGVLSEAGCPGVADPGAQLAAWAQAHGAEVRAHVGPSSILLALMGSGLEGQRFAFHGYLPLEAEPRIEAIRSLQTRSAGEQATQLFIETPYRNQALLGTLLTTLADDVRLCIATDLTGAEQRLQTRTVAQWQAAGVELPKLPTVFALLAARPAPVSSAPVAAKRRRGNPSSRHPHR